MREVITITISGGAADKRAKTIDIIGRSLVEKAGKSVAVINDGYATECAIASIPTCTNVFILRGCTI